MKKWNFSRILSPIPGQPMMGGSPVNLALYSNKMRRLPIKTISNLSNLPSKGPSPLETLKESEVAFQEKVVGPCLQIERGLSLAIEYKNKIK